ncbi:ABC1 kinase family protein [Adhaeretor mobilis]|uniref:Protein kinase domain-containing protein n=1 Tax=Adhaeretor mobilis TaxID=1930276 RepID=A0A517MXZ3_9BACT|nr:AarF/ABC1/UbiB kinase family protein [Adhaeretor mobilis]QDS99752.1 putative protein kinase UbiB [Adhaeretor mobilis]
MRIRAIPQIYRNVGRWGEILSILSKYGLAGWLSRFEFSFGKSWLKNRAGQILANESRSTRIRMALEELGPTFIKLGQILSTRPDLVGGELASELERLQTDVPADASDLVQQTIERELGQPVDQLFTDFDPVPIASASIGQVHRAVLPDGQVVAVKVQHEGIQQRVHVDLDILTGLAQLAERLPELAPYRPSATVAEFQRVLRRELDFDCELRHLDEFRQRFRDHKILRVPEPHPELSSDRVLVMEWLEGTPLSAVSKIDREDVDLTELARHGAEIYLDMIFDNGLYHADPHPGNLLLMRGGQIGLLDFGQVGRIDESLREEIVDMLLALVDQDARQLGTVLTRVAATPAGLNERTLHLDLADFTGHYAHQSADRFELGSALTELLDLLNRHAIALPSSMTLLLKVLVMLEGTGQRLEPRFSLMEVLQPYRKRMIAKRLSPTRQLRKARRIAYELEQLAEVLPRRLRDILQQVQSGSFDVHLDHRGLEPSVNRLVLGLLTSALFIGSVSLVTNDVWPIRGVSTPGLLGMILSGGLGMRLLRAINKSGHLDRRK